VRFEADYSEVFTGGTFDIGDVKTVGHLRGILAEMDAELAGWGDDLEISELWCKGTEIRVDLADGIPQ